MLGIQPAHNYFQPTRMISSMLNRGNSVLLSAPMGASVVALLNSAASQMVDCHDCKVIFFNLTYFSNGLLDIQGLFS